MALDFSKWLGAIRVFFGGKKKGPVLTATKEALSKSRKTEIRARNEKGHFIADDKSTPDINESYELPPRPYRTKKPKPKSKTHKKKTSKQKTSRSRGRKK